MNSPFASYNGPHPYLFVSYAHRNSDAVFEELKEIRDSGFNIWYDEGIEIGTEWREELAKAIEKASLFLFFVTPESVQSQNCRKEVNFALEHGIPVIAIHLEETNLPSGLKLALSDRQAILRDELSFESYNRKLQKVLESYLLPSSDLSREVVSNTPTTEAQAQAQIKQNFELLSIENLPPPKRSFGASLAVMFFILVFSALIGFSSGVFLLDESSKNLQPNEIVSVETIIHRLGSRQEPELDAIWVGLDSAIRKMLTEYVADASSAESLNVIEFKLRVGINKLIRSDIFLLGSLDANWRGDVKDLYQQFSDEEAASTNRAVIDLLFKEEVQRWSEEPDITDVFNRVQQHMEFGIYQGSWKLGLVLLLAFFGLIVFSAYMYTLGCIRATFNSRGNLEDLIIYLISEMGFHPPVREGNMLVFKATFATIFNYSVMKLVVKIDGMQVLITAPLPMIKRLSKRLKALSD